MADHAIAELESKLEKPSTEALVELQSLCNRLKLDSNAESVKRFGVSVSSLSASQVVEFYDQLQAELDELMDFTKNGPQGEGGGEEYKPENLAQLIAYMVSRETQYGHLMYSFYEKDEENNKWVHKENKVFHVYIEDNGDIFVDGKKSEYNVKNYLTHRIKSGIYLAEKEIGPRPNNWYAKWGSPCHFCPFSGVCNKYDMNLINDVDTFLDECNNAINNTKE